MTLRSEGVAACGEGVGNGLGEDGSNFLYGVTSGIVGGGMAGGIAIIGVFADEARDAICISMILPRLVLNFEVVFSLWSHFSAMWSVMRRNLLPQRYGRKCLTASMTARSSHSVTV